MQPETQRLINLLKATLRVLGISHREIARRIGMSPSYISKLFSGVSDLHLDDQADDMVRRVWFDMMTPPGKPGRVGREFFTLSKNRQDTAAGPLTRLVLAEGGFGANLRRGRLPKLIAPCIAELYEEGHHIYFPDGLPGSNKFSAPDCWIDYDSGRFSFAGEPSALKGSPVRIVRLARAGEPSAA